MEAEKSHHLPSASWRSRKPGHIIQSKFEDSRARVTDVRNSQHFGTSGNREWIFSLLIHIKISSRDALKDTPRNYFLPATWASRSPVKFTHKINHHTRYNSFLLLLQSRKIQLLIPNQAGEWQRSTMSTTRSMSPQTSAHCIFCGFEDTMEGSTHNCWNKALLTEEMQQGQHL